MFGEEILEVFWVLKINLSEEKEESIRASFEDQNVYFHYPSDLEDFNYLISNFTQKKSSYTDENNTLGENLITNKLIVMDDVSGLADRSEDFSNFLTVSRKDGFLCVYVFHTIYPGRQSWEMIMSQTHIFNFFPGSIYSTRILKTLAFFASRRRNTYVPNQQIWLKRLYFKISNSKEKNCLTIDTRDINEIGPGKLRTFAENGEVQTCFYNRNKIDVYFDSYYAKRVFSSKNIKFSIEKTNFYCFDLRYESFDFNQKMSNLNSDKSEEHSKSDKENRKNNGGFSKFRTESKDTVFGKRRGTTRRTDNRKKPKFM